MSFNPLAFRPATHNIPHTVETQSYEHFNEIIGKTLRIFSSTMAMITISARTVASIAAAAHLIAIPQPLLAIVYPQAFLIGMVALCAIFNVSCHAVADRISQPLIRSSLKFLARAVPCICIGAFISPLAFGSSALAFRILTWSTITLSGTLSLLSYRSNIDIKRIAKITCIALVSLALIAALATHVVPAALVYKAKFLMLLAIFNAAPVFIAYSETE